MHIPTVSRLGETGITPIFETAACEGRKANIPQNPPGILTPPIVSTPTHVYESIKELPTLHIQQE